jgi:purine catabolism regulator
VKFVQLTEAVHRRIIADQSAALQARDEVRSRFTALALRGSPADFIVHQLRGDARGAGDPRESRTRSRRRQCAARAGARALTGWEARSRAAHRAAAASPPAADDADGWLIVPVEARGTRWGHLVALPGPPHPRDASGCSNRARSLALGRLTDGVGEEWARSGAARCSRTCCLAASARSAPRRRVSRHPAFPSMARASSVSCSPEEEARSPRRSSAGWMPRRRHSAVVRCRRDGPAPGAEGRDGIRLLLSLPPRLAVDDALVTRFVRELPLPPGVPARLVVSVGPVANDLEGGLASLGEAIDLSRSPSGRGLRGGRPAGEGGVTGGTLEIRRSDDRPLARLVASLRDDHRALEHGERMLTPLIEYDLHRGGDLLDVLGAMLAHPGNRTAAASASHLSRSVFYQRIALIQDLLGVDLDDGEVLTALHFALLVRRSAVRA